jgi:hypothetical protein
MITVFNKLKWTPPVTAKLLRPPEVELNLAYPDDSIKTMPAKQKTIFDAKFKGYFDAKFNSMTQARMKQIQDAIKWTEERIQTKPTEAEKQEVVGTANQLLKQAFDTWQGEMQKVCDECVTKAYEDSVKAMKMKLIKAQIKSVAKIILIAGLVLTAAGLAIAASVATGGALAPLILGAIATGAGALYKAYKVYDSEWASSSNKIKEIQTDIKNLESAIKAYQKAEKSYAGVADKAKAFKAALLAPVTDIDKHVGQLDKYIFDMRTSLKEQQTNLAELADKATDSKSPEVISAVKTCQANIEKAADGLNDIEECKKSVLEIKTAYAAQKIPDYGKLNGVVARLGGNSSNVSQVGTSLKSAFSSLKKIGVAIPT